MQDRRKLCNNPTVSNNVGTTAIPTIWSPGYFALIFCLVLAIILVAYYLYHIRPYVLLPADILMWAETNFVGDIIKLRIGAPFYTDPVDSNSGIYCFGAPVVTYAISWLFGKSTSIVAWRIIQLFFVLCAAIVGTVCCRMLYERAYPDYRTPYHKTWLVFIFLTLLLTGTAPEANFYSHCLHTEALALVFSTLCLWMMLFYLKSPSWKRLILMAAFPALGFMVKQVLLCWAVVMFFCLLVYNPRDLKRLGVFIASVSMFIGITLGVCYWLWGDNFFFWTFEIMGGDRKFISLLSTKTFRVSLPRSLDHTVRILPEIAIGILGGCLIFREKENIRTLGPLWVAWLVLICIEAYSSGVGWSVFWHFGPGIFIGVIWLFSALPRFWPIPNKNGESEFALLFYWTRPLIAIVGILTFFTIMHVVPSADEYETRYYKRRPSPDVYRYIADIEREFEGFQADKVLLDIGNWIYLRHSVLAKDRAVSLADQPPNGIYDNLEVMITRIRNKTYDKILLHDFHSPYFLYDWANWERSSGVKKALLEHYTEVRTIPSVKMDQLGKTMIQYTGPVSVLIPKQDLNLKSTSRDL